MLTYWKASNGPVERVYLSIAPNRRIYAQRVGGDRVAWRGEGMDAKTAEQTAREKIGDLPGWSELRQMARTSASVDPRSDRNAFRDEGARRTASVRPSASRPLASRDDRRRPKIDPALLDKPYGTRETQKLDMSLLPRMPFPTRLVIDAREPREIAAILSRIGNLEVQVDDLDAGRYLVPDCLAMDRISTQDLHRGIMDDYRSLVTRVSALSEVDHASIFIVEGGMRSQRRASLEKIAGAVSYVSVVHRVPVVETIDVWETVYMIAKAVAHACHPLEEGLMPPVHQRVGRKDCRVSPIYVLQGIPGVSDVRADMLLEHFGNLKNVAVATFEELVAVQGLGPGVAQAIYDAFNKR